MKDSAKDKESAVWDVLFGSIRTLDDAYRLDDELAIVEQENFRSSGTTTPDKAKSTDFVERVRNKISFRLYQVMKELDDKKLIDFSDQDAVRLFFVNAHKQITSTPRMQIQVGVEVNDQMLNTIYAWVKQQVNTLIFLDVVYKPQVLAGCIIVYKGVFRDYSLRGQLEHNAKAVFKPILDRFADPLGATTKSIQNT